MKILIIGHGGREHALAWKIAQSEYVKKVYVAPGNAGTATEPKVTNINIYAIQDLIQFCQKECISLTIVGSETPLAEGIVDAFQVANLAILGPTRYCTQLESSKAFAKTFMQQQHIPTADYAIFQDPEKAHHYLNTKQAPIVIKADGLAAGKGVIVAKTIQEAHYAVDDMLQHKRFGQAGEKLLLKIF